MHARRIHLTYFLFTARFGRFIGPLLVDLVVLQNGAGLLVVSNWYGRNGRGDGGHYHAPSAQGSQGWYSNTAHPGATGT
jgi:hypothetical protein